MEEFVLNSLPSLGIGGLLALVVFYFYRKDQCESKAAWRRMNEEQQSLLKRSLEAFDRHTAAITELITWLRARNGAERR